jgi:hypothetical protein
VYAFSAVRYSDLGGALSAQPIVIVGTLDAMEGLHVSSAPEKLLLPSFGDCAEVLSLQVVETHSKKKQCIGL